MVKLTRIYTRGGDKGKTSLGNGQRVKKTHIRMEAMGSVDEVNACIGVIVSYLEKNDPVYITLCAIQNDLFDIGADLCMPETQGRPKLKLSETAVQWIEQQIDFYNQSLSDLTSFILPGGQQEAAYAHVARTVCRRAERILVGSEEQLGGDVRSICIYLNRLSDFLFVIARYFNDRKGIKDPLWVPGGGQQAGLKDLQKSL